MALKGISEEAMLLEICFENISIKNRNFIENNTALKEAVAAYFIENDYSYPAIKFVGIMMKQYVTNQDFWPDPKYYVSYDGITSIPCPWDFSDRKESNIVCDARARYPVFQNANRKDLALEIWFKFEALTDGFLNFGDVIAALYSGSSYGGKKGYIIRNAFNANGFSIPSGLSNKTLETYFYFKKNAYGELLGIYFKPGLGEFLFDNGISLQEFLDEYWENIEETANNDCEIGKAKDSNGNCVACVDKDVFGNCTKITWVRDADNDNYYAAGSERKEYPSWTAVTGFKKKSDTVGVDCDDTVKGKTTDCSKCDNRFTEPLPEGCSAITCPWNNNTCSWDENADKPCTSDNGKKANPLIDMKILPTPGDISARNGKPVNGDYGGRGGHHNGVDLAATPGTPIYAPYDGKITGNIVTSWPDDMGDLDWNEFRDKRKEDGSDSNSGGNRFRLEVVVDGQMYRIQYMHLQEGGVIHGRNTEVKAGDIIGYTGATGSVQAPGSGGPHLHIEYWKNGQYKNYADPKDFFQSEFDEFGNTTNPCN